MEPWERDWITTGLAWVGLRRWMHGYDDGERAWAWFQEQMDLHFDAKHATRMIGPGMASLLAAAGAELGLASSQECPNSV